jgi:hypothetical protein
LSLAGLRVDPAALEGLSEVERAAVASQLRELDEAYKRNPLLGYNSPFSEKRHPKQIEFHSPPWPKTRLFLGGNRSGKTTATFVDTIIQAVDREVVPEHLQPFKRWEPPFYCRIVGKDLTRWLEGVALQKMREWLPVEQLKGSGFTHGWDKQLSMLRFKNGSWIQFMSNDQDVDAFVGVALHRVVFDEPPREDIWGECWARLIDFNGEQLFGLTPTEGISNWLHDRWYEPWERLVVEGGMRESEFEREFRARLVLVDMDDNPHIDEEGKLQALEGYSALEREARKTGRFISMSGLIYPMWSKHRHVVPDPVGVPEGAECFEAVDPGMRQMAAVVFFYLTPEDDLVVYDELAVQGKTVAVVCEEIKRKRLEWGVPLPDGTRRPVQPRFTVIDPASRNKSAQTGRSDQQEYADHGIFTVPGQNDVRAGINRVAERLEADKLHVAARCTELQSEFKKYRWARPAARSEDAPRDRPVKRDDHLLDALRYGVMARPLKPQREIVMPSVSWRDRALAAELRRLRVPKPLQHPSGPGIYV